MNRYHTFAMMALVCTVAGCRSTPHDIDNASLQTPMEIEMGVSGSPLGPVRIRSGQLIALKLGCPPVEFRDANGKIIRELKYTIKPQPLVARPGAYSIVGHDPSGGECVVKIEVVDD